MENPEEILQLLERFTKLKQKEIPRELDDYLGFVAKTGDTVYRWTIVKALFREKLLSVITDFHDSTPGITDLPQYPNVDPFHYDRMKRTLLERLDAFNSAPFTVQRICELLTEPRKQYSRIDKFMRAVEKNILVVSTQEPGRQRSDSENGDSLDSIVNGDLEVNVDIEMDHEQFGHMESGGSIKELKDELPVETKLIELEPDQQEETPLQPETSNVEKENKNANEQEKNVEIENEEKMVNEAKSSNDDERGNSIIEKSSTVDEQMQPSEKEAAEEQVNDEAEAGFIVLQSGKRASDSDHSLPIQDQAETIEDPVSVENIEPIVELAEVTEEVPLVQEADTITVQKESEETAIDEDNKENVDIIEPKIKEELPVETKIEEVESSLNLNTDSTSSSSESASEESTPIVTNEGEEDDKTDGPEVTEESKSRESPKIEEVTEESEQPSSTVETQAEPIIDEAVEEIAKPEDPITQPEVSEAAIIEEIPVDESAKPADVDLAPAIVEMDTNNLAPENVMATDEEDVVPMAEESVKADDQAMEVDESSVEPMDQ